MNQLNQGPISSSPVDLPMKRKRGRPRKDENLAQAENKPVIAGSDAEIKNKQNTDTNNAVADDMVGQVVTGVIDGTFDAGYLLNVKVGDTDTHLRGLVFLPGRFAPITPANDVAPYATMYKRRDIPIPSLNPQTPLHGSVPPPEKIDMKPAEHNNHTPKSETQPSEQKSCTLPAENQFVSDTRPPPSNLPRNDTGLLLEDKITQPETSESVVESKTPPVMDQPEDFKIQKENDMAQQLETSMLLEGLNTDAGATKESEPPATPFSDLLPCIETADQNPPVEQQTGSYDLKSNDLVQNEVKSPNVDHNQTPFFPEPEPMSSEPTGVNSLIEKQVLEKEDAPQDMLPEPPTRLFPEMRHQT
ncbi:uncharacterized protein LOC110806771 [Carica papaya]|uniref:uncharacterized protein LOC110806771 n=1 Tax=Carica papaya TaxID=3649 RepID=UPI000B8C93B3|nr:uncharacterized protein LOC110806771 [Carica papaya]XP_021887396.1 uncharacterized protein LOC110806771 [Carica papaya]